MARTVWLLGGAAYSARRDVLSSVMAATLGEVVASCGLGVHECPVNPLEKLALDGLERWF